jgi:hypothetical protein
MVLIAGYSHGRFAIDGLLAKWTGDWALCAASDCGRPGDYGLPGPVRVDEAADRAASSGSVGELMFPLLWEPPEGNEPPADFRRSTGTW